MQMRTLFILLAGLLIFVVPVAAQDDAPTDDEVNAVAKQLYCPVCENVPLDVCGTQACAQWRDTIRDLLAQGYNEAEIHAYFAERYGDRVLAAPPVRGLNVLFWVLPPIIVVVASVFLTRYFRATRSAAAAAAKVKVAATSDDEYVDRLEQELARRR